MNTRKIFGYGTIAVMIMLLVCTLSLTGCPPEPDPGDQSLSGDITISPAEAVTVGATLTATYTGTETVSYQWNNGSTDVGTGLTYTPTTAGSYTVTVSAAGYISKTSDAVTVTIPESWTITWNLDGGTAGGAYPAQIVKGTVLAKPSDPAKADNIFGGWYTDSGLTTAYNFASAVTANLTLYAKWEVYQPPTGTSVTGSTLAEKLQWLTDNAQSNNSYTIQVSANEIIAPQTLSYTGESDITITLWDSGSAREISCSRNGPLFSVGSGVTLVLDNNITLKSRSDNTYSLVTVSGVLIMNNGAKITGNSASSTYGGGVYVNYDGTFTMNGGEISGNRAYASNVYYTSSAYGGGVYVNGGTFTMNGGKISGNTAYASVPTDTPTLNGPRNRGYAYGGGVYVSDGTFTMNDGEISGNTASGTGYAIYAYGGGVYVEYGTFTMNGGKISGNTTRYYGGGVYVSDGTFTMNGGEISGNTARDGGGGVSMGGTFRIVTGTVYGSDAAEGLRNTTGTNPSGAALSGKAERGTFSGTTWTKKGDLTTTNDTIKVVNGELE